MISSMNRTSLKTGITMLSFMGYAGTASTWMNNYAAGQHTN